MTTTISKRRKAIDLPEDVFKYLSIKAAANGINLKRYIETLLARDVEDINDNETYRNLCQTRPEGKTALDEDETSEFMDWLGIKER